MSRSSFSRLSRSIVACAIAMGAILALAAAAPIYRDTLNSAPLYAYTTDTKMVVASGSTVIAEYEGKFSGGSWLTWSFDGRYAAALEVKYPADQLRQIIVIDRFTRTVNKFDCGVCTSIAAVDRNRLLAVAPYIRRSLEISIYDLSSSKRLAALPSVDFTSLNKVYLLNSVEEKALALVTTVVQGRDSEPQLFFIHTNGSIKKLGRIEQSGSGFGQTAVTMRSADNRMLFAVEGIATIQTSSGQRCNRKSVSLVDAATGQIVPTDNMSIVNSRERGVVWGTDSRDLWWENGQLHWRVETSDCSFQKLPLTDPARKTKVDTWRLQGTTWVKADPISDVDANSVFNLGDGSVLTLNGGRDLYLKHSGTTEQTLVATGVRELATP